MTHVLHHRLPIELCAHIHFFVVASEILDAVVVYCRTSYIDDLLSKLQCTDHSVSSMMDIRDALRRAGRERVITCQHIALIEAYREADDFYEDELFCEFRESIRDQIDALCLMMF